MVIIIINASGRKEPSSSPLSSWHNDTNDGVVKKGFSDSGKVDLEEWPPLEKSRVVVKKEPKKSYGPNNSLA